MLSSIFLRSFRSDNSRKKKAYGIMQTCDEIEVPELQQLSCSFPVIRDQSAKQTTKHSLRSEIPQLKNSSYPSQTRTDLPSIKKMSATNKVSNFSNLIQRATPSCLLNPLGSTRLANDSSVLPSPDYSGDDDYKTQEEDEYHYADDDDEGDSLMNKRVVQIEMLTGEVFEAFSGMKRAYVSLQEAHCPWDPNKMRVADVAIVAEFRRIGVFREKFRRSIRNAGGSGRWRVGSVTLREVVEPYEAAVEELKSLVKAKELEILNLREKLKTVSSLEKVSSKSKRKVSCSTQAGTSLAASPAPELFESTMSLVKEAAKSFTAMLLSLMRSAHWDITAAVRSIEAASFSSSSTNTSPAATHTATGNIFTDSIVVANHAKYALESYINRKMFQGFDHETFYMDGSLSSLMHKDQHWRDCFTQYKDIKEMDPIELLGILPSCGFGKFCFKKYLAIVHPKMEESLFGDLEQRRLVLAGNHPRSQFYGEFLELAKAVWLLHLLAFSMEPPPSHFEATKGADFHPQYMDSVVRVPLAGSGGRMSAGVPQVVGFPVSPGFKLGNGYLMKARVYLVTKNGH